jgi:hypothetical protein
MATLRQFEHYLSGRIAFFETAQREANDSEKDQFDLVLVELNHMYTEIIPKLEVDDGSV